MHPCIYISICNLNEKHKIEKNKYENINNNY